MPSNDTEASVDDHLITLNPIVGVNLEDLASATSDVLQAAALQPVVAAEHLLKLNGELIRVLFGASEHQPSARDRRFAHEDYQSNPVYSRLARSWVAWNDVVNDWVDAMGFEGEDLEKARFVTSLATDSLAPSNFLLSNPAALRRAFETRGRSLADGLKNFLDDLRHNHGMPSQVDKSAFQVGGNLATTPGAVIHRDEILELIQYQPKTDRQHGQPLFIVPPQINKYYIYDMAPEKSMVAYLLDAGVPGVYGVLAQSDRRAPCLGSGRLRHLLSMSALEVDPGRLQAPSSVNVVGACAGGITLATALGYLAGREESRTRWLR